MDVEGSNGLPPGGEAPRLHDQKGFLERRGITPVAFGYLCVLGFFVLYQVIGGAITVLLVGVSPDFSDPAGFRTFTASAQMLLLFLPALLLARLADPEPFRFLRMGAPPLKPLFASLAGVFSLNMMLQVYLVVQEMIPLPPGLEALLDRVKETYDAALLNLLKADSTAEFLWVVAVIAVVPGLAEEFVFRGVIQRSLQKSLGPVKALVITGVIFGAFHLNPFSLVPLIVLGVYLGFLAWRADSIWVSSAAHFFNNLIPVAALHFGVADQSIVTGEMGDVPPGQLAAMLWFSGVIFLLSTYYFVHITRPNRVSSHA